MTQATTRPLPKLDRNKIRFAVGTPNGPRSAWWFVKMEDKGDVYVSVRSLGQHLKLSLHGPHEDANQDRFCQFGFPRSRLDTMKEAGLQPPDKHYFFRWQRPRTPQDGALHAMKLIIPTDLLNKDPPPIEENRIKFLFKPAPEGHAFEFSLYYSLESASSLEDRFKRICKPMIYNKLDTGEIVHFVYRVVPFDTPTFLARGWGRPSPLSGDIGQLQPGASLTGLTVIVWNDPHADRCIQFLEASNAMLSKAAGSS